MKGIPMQIGVALALVASACDDGDSNTPESPIRTFIAAADDHDFTAVRSTIAKAARLAEVLTCPSNSRLIETADHMREGGYARQLRGQRVRLVRLDLERKWTIAAGQKLRDCTAVVPLEVATYHVRTRLDGQLQSESVTVMRLDDRWRIVPGR